MIKWILWGLNILQLGLLVWLTDITQNRPFGVLNMAQAYFMGCMLHVEPTVEGKDKCVDAAANFGSHLANSLDLTIEE